MISIRLHTVFLPLALILYSVSIKAQLTWEFVNELSDGNVVEVNAVEADTSRSCIYIAGTFNSDLSATFPSGLNGTPDFSVNNGGTDGFVAKYLEDGTLVWAFMIGGAGSDIINDLDVDLSGNIYITGSFNTVAEFRGTEATSFSNASSFGGDDIFYAKYDVDGKFQWLHEDGGASNDAGVRVEIVNSNVVVAGEYESAGLTEIAGVTPAIYGGVDVCLVGLDLNGAVLWNADGGSNGNDWAGGLAGEGDSVYIGVNFTGSNMTYTDFGLNTTAAQMNTLFGFSDISVCSFGASSGLYGWTEQVRGGSDAFCYDMIANSADLILCGSYNVGITFPTLGLGPFTMGLSYDAITWSMDNDNGACSWYCAEQTTGVTDARATCLEFDQAGNIVIGGEFDGQLDIRTTYTMNSIAGNDLFTVGYTSLGAYVFHDSASSIGVIDMNDLTINGVNDIYYVGSNNSNVVFSPLSTTLSGSADGFFAKLSNCDAAFSYSSASFCSGNPNVLPSISGDSGGAFSESTGNIVFADPATGEIDLTASVISGPYDVTYTAPAGCQEIQAITIVPNADPVFSSCPLSITAFNNPGSCDTTIVYALPTATDDCGAVTIVQTDLTGYTTGDNFPVGTTNQEYTATDLAGNTAICTFTVDVIDNEPPTFTFCPNNMSQGNTIGTCGASVSFSSPIATDNCSVTVSQISGLASGATFPIDTTINTFVATDIFGNTDTCSFIVVVEDVEAPAITCPSDIIQPNDAGQCSAIVNYSVPTGTDNCFVDSTWISLGDSSGASFLVGPPITVEYFVQDIAGLQSSCSFTITVVDTANPTVSCPSDTTLYTDVASCEVLFSYSVPIGDNCGSPVLNQDAGLPSGSLFPQGATVNTFSVVDASLNPATCSFSVTVIDTIAPLAVCFSDTTLTNDPDSCGAIFTYTLPTVTDNCDTVFSISQIDTSGLFPGDLFPIGTTEIMFTVEDNSGNVDTCNFFVTVIDVDSPTLSNCPPDTVLNNDSSLCGAVFVYALPSAMDNCGSILTPVQIDTTGYMSNDLFPVGTTQLVYAVTDSAGNSDTCSFTITVNDVESPVLSCAADTTIFNNTDSCGAFFNYPTPMANDNCDTSLTIVQIDTSGYVSGDLFPVGATEIVYAVSDIAGNSDTCSFTITVADTAAPVISCLSDTSIFNDPDSCGAIFNYAMPTAYDNCDVLFDTIKIDTSGYSSGDMFPIGATEISYVYRDLSGNADTCSFQVTVVDNQKPELVCHADTSMQNDSTLCGAVYTFALPTASDNCSAVLTPVQIDTTGYGSTDLFPVGTTQLIYAVTDISGNSDTCSFLVIVNDVEPPILNCPPDTTIANDTDSCGAFFTYPLPTASDNCDTVLTINQIDTLGYVSGDLFPVGTTELIYSVSDMAGNSDTCSFTIIVVDTAAPMISCLSDTSIFNDTDSCGAIFNYAMPTAYDNCDVSFDTIKIDTSGYFSGDLFPVGTTEISYVYRDQSGNADTCSFQVTVVDNQKPQLICHADTSMQNDAGVCGAVFSYSFPTASDNCLVDTIFQIAGLLSDSIYPVDTIVNTFVAIDIYGNTDTCSFEVGVRDGQLPTFSVAYADSILFADPGSCFRTVYYSMPFYDNCPGAYVIASDSSGSEINVTGPLASDTIYFTVFDATGLNAPGHRTYRILDAETPIITCQADDTIYSSPITCGAMYNYEAPNVSDNCGVHPDSIYTLGGVPPAPAFFPVGNNFIDWKVVDYWGNSSTCSQTITVLDTISPELFCPSDTVLCDSVYHYPLPLYSDSCGIRSLTTSIGTLILPNDSTYTFPVDTTTLKYTVLDLDSNLSSCSFNIVVLPPIFPFWDTLPQVVCLQADTIDLRALASPTPGRFSGSGVLGESDFLAQVAGVGVHDITFTVENAACSKDSTYPIEVLPNPVIDAGQDDSICGLIYVLEGSSSMTGYWFSDSMMVDVQGDVGSSCSAPNYSTYELIWQITGPPTCEASDSVSVTFDEQISAYAGPDQYILEDLETAFQADSLVLGEGYWDILLGTGEIVDIADPNSMFFPSTYGVYELEWVVQNGSCPPVIDDLLLEFRRIAIPQGLSPNWDGLNDEFIVPGISQFAYKEIKIYDRWGKLVYQDADYNNDWRGTNLNDERLIDDTYFYEVTLDTYTLTGFILIKSN